MQSHDSISTIQSMDHYHEATTLISLITQSEVKGRQTLLGNTDSNSDSGSGKLLGKRIHTGFSISICLTLKMGIIRCVGFLGCHNKEQ